MIPVRENAQVGGGITSPPDSYRKSYRKKLPVVDEDFAVTFDALPQNLIDEQDEAEGFARLEIGKISADWRIERRFYTKKDGTIMLYWNYRARQTHLSEDGNRLVNYKKGGKRIWRKPKQ